MKCPICGHRVFLQRKWNPEVTVVNFETRTRQIIKKPSRKKFNYCANCGYRLYKEEITQFNKEFKYLREFENEYRSSEYAN